MPSPLATEYIEAAAAAAHKKGRAVIRIFADCNGIDSIGHAGTGFLEPVCTIHTDNPSAGIEEYQSVRKTYV